jgi:hypothetical protein
MKKEYFFLTIVSVIFMMMAGCAATGGTITDFQQRTSRVSAMLVEGKRFLRIYNGDVVHSLDLKRIKSITLQADVTILFNREQYCLAAITLKDGTTIGTFEAGKPKTYITTDTYITGKGPSGKFRILTGSLSRIDFD